MFYIEVNRYWKQSGGALTQAGIPRKKWFDAGEDSPLLVGIGHPFCAVINRNGRMSQSHFRYFRVEVAEESSELIYRDCGGELPEAAFSCRRARIVEEVLEDDPLLSTEHSMAMVLNGPQRVRLAAFRFVQDRSGFEAMIPHARRIFSPFVQRKILHQDDKEYLPFLHTLLNMLCKEEEDITLLLKTFRDTRSTWYEHPILSRHLFSTVLPLLEDAEEIRTSVEDFYGRRDALVSSDMDLLRAAMEQIAAIKGGGIVLFRIIQETSVRNLRSKVIKVLRKVDPPPIGLLMRCAINHPDLSDKALSWMEATTGDLEAAKNLVKLTKVGSEQQREAVRSVYSSFGVLVSVPGGDTFAFEVACDTRLPIELRVEAIVALDANKHMETLLQWLTSDTEREEVRCASLVTIAESVKGVDFSNQHALAPYMDELAQVAFVGRACLPLFLDNAVRRHLFVRGNNFGVTWLQQQGVRSNNRHIRCRAVRCVTDKQLLLDLKESESVQSVSLEISRRLLQI